MFVDRVRAARRRARCSSCSATGDPPSKVDFLILGDGYTAAERGKFEKRRAAAGGHPLRRLAVQGARGATSTSGASARRRPSRHLAPVDRHPPRARRWARPTTPSAPSATSSPSTTARLRDVAAFAPYEFVEILINSQHLRRRRHLRPLRHRGRRQRCGRPTSSSTSSATTSPALADEYYTSDVAYEPAAERVEPWEPNVTALARPGDSSSGSDLVDAGHAAAHALAEGGVRGALARDPGASGGRSAPRTGPRSEMDALFREQRDEETKLPRRREVRRQGRRLRGREVRGQGLLPARRSTASCSPATGAVLRRSAGARIERVIDLYAK